MWQALKHLNSSSDVFQFSCTIVVSEKTGFIKPRFQVQNIETKELSADRCLLFKPRFQVPKIETKELSADRCLLTYEPLAGLV